MFYASLTDVLNSPLLATARSERIFFWFMVVSGAIMFIGVVAEVLFYWRRDRISARQGEAETPAETRGKTATDTSKLSKV